MYLHPKADIQPFLVPRLMKTCMTIVIKGPLCLHWKGMTWITRTEEWRRRECKVPGAPPLKVNHRFGGDLLKRALDKSLDGENVNTWLDLEKKGGVVY